MLSRATTITMASWQVQLIDIGFITIVDMNQLWQLPEHFKMIPRQVSQCANVYGDPTTRC